MAIISTSNLTKSFGDLVAVNGLNLGINEGECFGLLGPNGAGKTSLIRMMTGVSPISRGEICIDGRNLAKQPREVKAILGVVPQIDNLDPDLNVLQNLLTFARYFSISGSEAKERSLAVLRLFQLEDKSKNRLKELSGGMKRRLLIARGLLNNPRILVLDEPSIGLDPQARHLVWQKLVQLKRDGVTQLLCTQNMEEAGRLCDRVAIIHLGNILALDTPANLITEHVGKRIWIIHPEPEERENLLATLREQGVDFETDGAEVQVFHVDEVKASRLGARPRPATLEDVFFKLTGRTLLE